MSKEMVLIWNGRITSVRVPQPPSPRSSHKWKTRMATHARHRAQHYAAHFFGEWEVMHVDSAEPIKSFPNREAAEMWLLHRSARP